MSRRRKVNMRFHLQPESDDSDYTPSVITRKRKKRSRTTNCASTSLLNSVEINIPNPNSEDETPDEHKKEIEEKVKLFFKSANFLSESEDESKCIERQVPKKEDKKTGFYELPDSEDEITNKDIILEVNNECVSETVSTDLLLESSSKDLLEDKLVVDISINLNDSFTTDKKSLDDLNKEAEMALAEADKLLHKISGKSVECTKAAEDDSKKCPVCLELFEGKRTPYTTYCGHIFCKSCLLSIASTQRKCPCCRKSVTKKSIHPIYL